jgi:mRNA interferase MazF
MTPSLLMIRSKRNSAQQRGGSKKQAMKTVRNEPMGQRPAVVIQSDAINDSKINPVIILAITSTLRYGELPGNVTLRKGEANLPKRCVINVSQIRSVEKNSIREKIRTLTKVKLEKVEESLKLVCDV